MARKAKILPQLGDVQKLESVRRYRNSPYTTCPARSAHVTRLGVTTLRKGAHGKIQLGKVREGVGQIHYDEQKGGTLSLYFMNVYFSRRSEINCAFQVPRDTIDRDIRASLWCDRIDQMPSSARTNGTTTQSQWLAQCAGEDWNRGRRNLTMLLLNWPYSMLMCVCVRLVFQHKNTYTRGNSIGCR
jgi:hypothetical protein